MQRTATLPFAFGELTVGLNIKPPKNRDRCRCLDAAWAELIALATDAGQHINAHAGIETLEQPLVVKKRSTFTLGGLTFTITAKATSHLAINEATILEALNTELFDFEDAIADAFFEARDGEIQVIGLDLIVIEDGAGLFNLADDLGRDTVTQMLATMSGGRTLRDMVTEVFDNRRGFPLSDLLGNGATAMRERFTRRETERQRPGRAPVDGMRTGERHQRVHPDPRLATHRSPTNGTGTDGHLTDETFEDIALMYGITPEQLEMCISNALREVDGTVTAPQASPRLLTSTRIKQLIEQCGEVFTRQVKTIRAEQSRRDFETKSPFQAMTELYQGFGFTDSHEFTTTVIALALMSHGGEFVSEFLERNKVHPRQMNALVVGHLIEEAQIGTLLHDVASLAYGLAKV